MLIFEVEIFCAGMTKEGSSSLIGLETRSGEITVKCLFIRGYADCLSKTTNFRLCSLAPNLYNAGFCKKKHMKLCKK